MELFHQQFIPPWLAGISCVLFTLLFVGSLYLFPIPGDNSRVKDKEINRSSPEYQSLRRRLGRDHPLVIQQRVKGTILTMILVPIYLWFVFSYTGVLSSELTFAARFNIFLRLLGIMIPSNPIKLLSHLFMPVALVAILFLGPLFKMFLNKELPFQSQFQWTAHWCHFKEWIGIRNYIVGPISEEHVFRACMVAIAACSGASVNAMVFGLSLVFGIAHLHHAYESYVKNGRTRQALVQSIMVALLQLTYTSLFGWFATFLFLRTSNILGPCLSHIFCNMMGLPDLSDIQLYGHWKKWIYFSFLLGMVSFGVLLGPMTNPSLYGDATSSIYWPLMVA
ncbi:hypothetical protein BX616_006816 [Lobosporangium transversale]|uniref:intramembrane prenyl-peptidase Rce1 n=1 Tax=Lobosporangium transversale TaxID=64571 RepID=A0A1Y2G766_9FUNG|nr:hypothetical protein BCR41DRAFT_240754 [Lobosporangium transversale]KAF9915146.1 hypothetical protein BX616_006816 [Lobosporangium transversale]ORY95147.1 hypothetical protein BCR41DRAFT_240754 [Lobosporangium transversale]|eukprot:XP_021875354.1 hypothetical protein BCR41DRAFT_240754 [Lobosporangium transversale]